MYFCFESNSIDITIRAYVTSIFAHYKNSKCHHFQNKYSTKTPNINPIRIPVLYTKKQNETIRNDNIHTLTHSRSTISILRFANVYISVSDPRNSACDVFASQFVYELIQTNCGCTSPLCRSAAVAFATDVDDDACMLASN